LSKYKVLLNCIKKSVKLTTLEGNEIEFIAEPVVTAKGVANRAKVNQLDASQGSEVPMVNEFPDVFPEELPGMPPDRDIEFVIELKEHIKELLEKGFICRSSSPWEHM
jgi:hypothetical protein